MLSRIVDFLRTQIVLLIDFFYFFSSFVASVCDFSDEWTKALCYHHLPLVWFGVIHLCEPRREKTCLRGSRSSEDVDQTVLLFSVIGAINVTSLEGFSLMQTARTLIRLAEWTVWAEPLLVIHVKNSFFATSHITKSISNARRQSTSNTMKMSAIICKVLLLYYLWTSIRHDKTYET